MAAVQFHLTVISGQVNGWIALNERPSGKNGFEDSADSWLDNYNSLVKYEKDVYTDEFPTKYYIKISGWTEATYVLAVTTIRNAGSQLMKLYEGEVQHMYMTDTTAKHQYAIENVYVPKDAFENGSFFIAFQLTPLRGLFDIIIVCNGLQETNVNTNADMTVFRNSYNPNNCLIPNQYNSFNVTIILNKWFNLFTDELEASSDYNYKFEYFTQNTVRDI